MPGYEFGYTPFKELPPARVTVIEEVIISENKGDQLPGSLKIQHNDPVTKDIKIELPLGLISLVLSPLVMPMVKCSL